MRGGIVVTASGAPLVVDDFQFTVATTAGGESIPLNPAGITNRTVLAYRDADTVDNDVVYTITNIVGDGDTLLEPGELLLITVDRATGIADQTSGLAPTLVPNERFTFEIQTPVGATLDVTRQIPSELELVMQLH